MSFTSVKPSRWWSFIAGAYAITLVCGTHWPSTPSPVPLTHFDKVMHFGAYLVLASLVTMAWLPIDPTRRRGFYRRALIGLLIFAALDELTQWPVPGRSADFMDWLADGIGIAAGLWLSSRVRGRASSPETLTTSEAETSS